MVSPSKRRRNSAPPTARALAIRVLRDVDRGAFSNRALSEHLERWPSMDPRDRGLATTLVYGVLRHRARLDSHIDAAARKPAGLKGEIRDALRIATFELLELQRPAGIAIAEARKTVRSLAGGRGLDGVVQAVLSQIERTAADVESALDRAPPLDVLERRWSIPRWLGGRWIKQLGPERALARARALSTPPPVDLRIDLSRISAEEARQRLLDEHPGATVETVAEQPQALRVHRGGDLFYGPSHDEGLVSVQGLGAQQAAIRLAPSPGKRVLDACAGMGVKTLQLAELMQRRGTIVAAELDPAQLDKFAEVERRGRLDDEALSIETIEADVSAEDPILDDEPFDAILLDVPCTGLGNLARHPEIRWHRRFEDIGAHVPLQTELLKRCTTRLAPGGRLVYAVCSFAPEEGAQVVSTVLAETTGELKLVAERTFTPEDDSTEGFYVATFERS
jgi:16S rRNA (cytosine967-C5)-methyltransferase